MRVLSYTAKPLEDGRKVIDILKKELNLSSRLITRLKHYEEGIQVNGHHARTVDIVTPGDVVSVHLKDFAQTLEKSDKTVEVLYEDEDVIVYNKPAFMPCHPSKNHQTDTLANVFAANYPDKTFRVLTRLDRDTSGAVVVAKNAHSAAVLTDTGVQKEYLAIVEGVLARPEGEIEAPIARKNARETVRIVSQEGQYAKTYFKLLRQGETHAYLQLLLQTGRTHQIRVHMAYLGHPLAGDDMYGGSLSMISRQALHCKKVWFSHPITKQPIVVSAQLPDDMKDMLQRI